MVLLMVELTRRLDAAYNRQHERIVGTLKNSVRAAWLALPNYRDADVARFKRFAVPLIETAHTQIASLAAGYYAEYGRADGVEVPRVSLPREQVVEPRGVPNSDLVDRWAVTVYTKLSEGAGMTAAVGASVARLSTMVGVDAQLVRTLQARRSLSGSGYTYYVRELRGEKNCALCTIASTQRYRVSELMPIHGNCDCQPRAVKADFDPGQVINPSLLEETHGKVRELAGVADRGGRAPDYRELIFVRENSETGPTLVWRGQNFDPAPF